MVCLTRCHLLRLCACPGHTRWLHDNSGFFFARFPVPKTMLANPDMKKSAGTETDVNHNQQVTGRAKHCACPRCG